MKTSLRNLDKQTDVYTTQFAKTKFSETLKDLPLITSVNEIISVGREHEYSSISDSPAVVHKFGSILFNGDIEIENGMARIDECAETSLIAIEELFKWIMRMDSKKLQAFIENFEITVSDFSRKYPDEAPEFNASLSDLQHLSRLIACLIPESKKIYNDIKKIQDADKVAVSIKQHEAA